MKLLIYCTRRTRLPQIRCWILQARHISLLVIMVLSMLYMYSQTALF